MPVAGLSDALLSDRQKKSAAPEEATLNKQQTLKTTE